MRNKGFTLVELIAVIAIIVIVASIGAPAYFNSLHRKEMEADEMAAYQLTDSTESYALVTGRSLDSASSNFIFSDCYLSGSLDADLMMDKLMENGFLLSRPVIQSKNAEFIWDTSTRKWKVKEIE
ncbi:MAG: prepilin-type N-terminal cleavage/methylation domain-containing protein [Clostridia bacterium]|nr:prepilin-type N-terminal cleavage/methylation domain-containing protein [Clostridia bacterium]